MRSYPSGDAVADVLGTYPRGVVVLTALSAEGELAATVTDSFATVSTSPPVISLAVPKSSPGFAHILDSGTFCVNVLAIDQESLCRRMGSEVRSNRMDGVEWRPSPAGSPILAGVVSWMDCSITAVADGDSSHLVIASITGLEVERDVMPLLHFQRGYGTFAAGSLVTSHDGEYADYGTLVDSARDSIELLARDLGVECSVIARVGEDTVFVATSNHSALGRPTRLGMRSPILPPLGCLFVDAPGAPTAEEWLNRLGTDADGMALRTLARQQLDRVRRRGWSISLRGKFTIAELDEAVAGYTSPARTAEDEQRLLDLLRVMSQFHEVPDLRAGESYDVLQLAVPVRDGIGNTLGALRLGDLPTQARGDEIMFWLSQLQASARAVERKMQNPFAGEDFPHR